MSRAVSIVQYITNNVDDSCFFAFIQEEKYDFNFLLRCIKQISRFLSDLRLCGVFVEWTLQCFLNSDSESDMITFYP